MAKRILISALLTGVLLLTGACVRHENPELESDIGLIGFSASSMQIETKTIPNGPIDGFHVDDVFDVYGIRHWGEQKEDIFEGADVQLKSINGPSDSTWTSTPSKSWNWHSTTEHYDFIGVWPTGVSSYEFANNRLRVLSNFYNINYGGNHNDYDLMMAGYQRKGDVLQPNAKVPLYFYHMLCAVRVVVTNDSQGYDITLNSYSFRHLILRGKAIATFDAFNRPYFDWGNTVRDASVSTIREVTPSETLYAKNNETEEHRRTYTGGYEFFIPADLTVTSNGSSNPDCLPVLNLSYRSDETDYNEPIILRNVQRKNKSYITEWKPGVKYTYHISIRLDGAVIVTVYTTDWDEVEAETPGLMIEQ